MSRVTTRQALDRIRRSILAFNDPIIGPLTEDEVTITQPYITDIVKRGINIACTGFPLKRRNEKQDKRFINIEYRQTMEKNPATKVYDPSVDDVMDVAYHLSDVMTRNDLLGVTLEPDQDAFEGADPKYENVYLLAWRFLAIL